MRIHIEDEYHPFFVVVKDGAPLGLVRWADTSTMEYCRRIYKDNKIEGKEYGRFDKLVLMAVDDLNKDIPTDILEQAKADPAIEVVVTPEDRKRVHEEMGVFIPGVDDDNVDGAVDRLRGALDG
jgi:hypothetical protein